MTRDEAKQLLPVIQAWAEGKTVQFENYPGSWRETDTPNFTALDTHGRILKWRIKPEPREVWIAFSKIGCAEVLESPSDAPCSDAWFKPRLFREVIE